MEVETMKKWMVIVALLATAQIAAKSISVAKGMTPFDDRFNDAPADRIKMAHSLIKKAYKLYDTGMINVLPFYKIVKFVAVYLPKYPLSNAYEKTEKIAYYLNQLKGGNLTETMFNKQLDKILK